MPRLSTQAPLPGRKPTHRLYRVLGDGKAASWTPIGAAWPNKDGLGFSLQCDAVPLQGRLVLRAITERTEPDKGEAA
jgi:hypothetical protein